MAYALPASLKFTHPGQAFVALSLFGVYRLELIDDFALGCEVLVLLLADCRILAFPVFEELVARRSETLPNGIAVTAGYATNGLPLVLQGNYLVSNLVAVLAFKQSLHLFAEGSLFGKVVGEFLLYALVIFRLGSEKLVASLAETCEQLIIHFL